jgi:hypothetical protein
MTEYDNAILKLLPGLEYNKMEEKTIRIPDKIIEILKSGTDKSKILDCWDEKDFYGYIFLVGFERLYAVTHIEINFDEED